MLKPTTVRISKDVLDEITKFVRHFKIDRSRYFREIITKGFSEDKEERILDLYEKEELSLEEASKFLGLSHWEFFDVLASKRKHLNVSLEEVLKSSSLE